MPFIVFLMIGLFANGSMLFAQNKLDLGKVNENKLNSYKKYFGQYLDELDPIFADSEFGDKVLEEAKGVMNWLRSDESWPNSEKITSSMHRNAGQLFEYFANIRLNGSQKLSSEHWLKSLDMEPGQFELHYRLARYFYSNENQDLKKALHHFNEAIELDSNKAKENNLYFYVGKIALDLGEFKQSYENIKLQAGYNSEYENTSNLLFVFEMWIDEWGFVPEQIKRESGEGNYLPEPIVQD